MQHLYTLDTWRHVANDARSQGQRVGLVPTMGALHAGHESLINVARAQCDVVIVSIFVNPRQFDDANDLARYPSTIEADVALCERAGVDVIVEPTLQEMWPSSPIATPTTVAVRGVADGFEGASRRGHFDGVASVVAKLFNLTGPCRAYFGEKDFQQLAVVKQMVRDLAIPVFVVGCPIIRDTDGLALSSRNVRLSASGRTAALGLSRAVRAAGDLVGGDARAIRGVLNEVLDSYRIDVAYAEVVEPESLVAIREEYSGVARVLVAGEVDGVRLLDNGPVTVYPLGGERRATGH